MSYAQGPKRPNAKARRNENEEKAGRQGDNGFHKLPRGQFHLASELNGSGRQRSDQDSRQITERNANRSNERRQHECRSNADQTVRQQRKSEQAFCTKTGHGYYHGQHPRSEEHTSELQSRQYLVCRLLL